MRPSPPLDKAEAAATLGTEGGDEEVAATESCEPLGLFLGKA
jgi:hypothetical protein